MPDTEIEIMNDETLDEIKGVRVIQKKNGYRFSVDSLLLADFPDLTGVRTAVDLGTGSGIVAILLAVRSERLRVVGIELQEGLFDLAMRNVRISALSDRVEIMREDLRGLKDRFEGGSFDLVVSNPPYHPVGKGRIGPNLERTVARHEVSATMADIIKVSEFLLKEGGRVELIYPVGRLNEVISIMGNTKIGPRRFEKVFTRDTRLVMIEGEKGYKGELFEGVPLCL